MTLGDLRAGTLDWLDDPMGDKFAPNGDYARIDRLINESYRHTVNQVDLIPRAWSMVEGASIVVVTTNPDQREYHLGTGRRCVSVTEPLDGNREPEIAMFTWAERNTVDIGVYVYRRERSSFDRILLLGFCAMPPGYTTVNAYVLQAINKLTADHDVPYLVPEDFHDCVQYRAAMLGQMQVKRDSKQAEALYVDRVNQMRATLAMGPSGGLSAPRLNRAGAYRMRRHA